MTPGEALQFVGAAMITGVLLGCGAAYAVIYAGPMGVVTLGLVGGGVLMASGAVLNKRQRSKSNGTQLK